MKHDQFLLVATAKTCDVSLAVYQTERAARDAARDYWTAERVLEKANEQFYEPPTADDLLEISLQEIASDGTISVLDEQVRRFDDPNEKPVRVEFVTGVALQIAKDGTVRHIDPETGRELSPDDDRDRKTAEAIKLHLKHHHGIDA